MKISKIAQITPPSNKYNAIVKLNVNGSFENNLDINYNKNINIPFIIEQDIRDWGIKETNVIINGLINIPIQINHWGEEKDREEEKVINVDLEKIDKDAQPGKGTIRITDLDIYLDNTFNVDYRNSVLTYLQ
jgi:hypothetical protein